VLVLTGSAGPGLFLLRRGLRLLLSKQAFEYLPLGRRKIFPHAFEEALGVLKFDGFHHVIRPTAIELKNSIYFSIFRALAFVRQGGG
jgi:hypothetical protein